MKKKILLVDDEPDMLIVFEALLEGAGYKVIRAANGKEAVKKAKEEQPDLIVLDIKMPEMDGVEATDMLKDNDATRDIPIVYLSNLVRKEQVKEGGYVEGSKIGNINFIPKTASRKEIVDIIRKNIK